MGGAALLCLVASARSELHAQGTISGKVTAEATGQPLSGAHVLVLGTPANAIAGDDGRYTIRNVRTGSVELQVLNVGFRSAKKTVTVTAGATTEADFQLAVAITQLADVVVSSTGQVTRRVELGNAVSTLGDVSKNVETKPIDNITDLLVAKTPGVIVLPSPVLGGNPTLRIRGVSSLSLTNAPIWVVDGVRYLTNSTTSAGQTPIGLLNSLNPEEIEDIEIVKGPSAATLYGTNAANGVVVVTTKKGRAGKSRWNYTAESRSVVDRNQYQEQMALWGHAPATPTVNKRCQLGTMNTFAADGTPIFTNTALSAASQCVADSLTHYDPFSDPSNTMLAIGRGSLFGMNVSGGTEAVRFFVSGDLDNEFGPIKMPAPDIEYYNSIKVPVTDQMLHPRQQQKMNFRTNLSATVNPKLDLNVNAGFAKTYNTIEPDNSLIIALLYTGQAGYGYKGCPGNASPCGLDKPYRDPTGFPLHDYNSFAPGSVMQYVEPINVQRFTGSTDANWRPLSWMQNDVSVGVDLAIQDDFHVCRLNECPASGATARVGNVFNQKTNRRNFSAKGASTATWQYNPALNFKTTVGADYTNEEFDQLTGQTRGLAPGASSLGAGSTLLTASGSAPQAVKTLGYYIQEAAALNDRLFLTLAVRQDQNSAFGSNFQSIFYPKAGLSWIVSDEDFFPKFSWLDNLRVRTAYGANGVQPRATDGLRTFSSVTTTIATRDATTGTDVSGLQASNPGNANLKPEKSAEFEAGFETDVINRRLHFDYTYYNKKTHDALISVPIPASVGASVTSLLQNVGSTQNWGHEVQLNAQILSMRAFAWDVTVSGSHNSNKWLDLGTDLTTCKTDATTGLVDPATCKERIIGNGGTTQQRVGYPLFAQWYKGYTYDDANHDGILQVSEVQVDSARFNTGYNAPRDLFSVQNGFDLFDRKLRINAMFDYKGGGNANDGTNSFDCTSVPVACPETQDKNTPLWRQARAIAATYGTVVGGVTQKTSLGYYQNDQFWRFRELSAAYQLPNQVTKWVKATAGSSLVFGVRNIHTWTKFTGIDPEANYGLNASENQNEFNTAPQPTYFTMRLNLKY